MKTIDQWEADSKRLYIFSDSVSQVQFLQSRILALIDLVRKKDEALIEMQSCAEGHLTKIAKEALALTEQLK